MKKLILAALMALLPLTSSFAETAVVGSPAPDFSLADSNGKSQKLSENKGKWIVLEWVNFDCPFVKKHYSSGNMQRMQDKLTKDGVVWMSVDSSAPGKQGHLSADEANARQAEVGSKATAFLIDGDGKVGAMYGAKTTPHMFLINPKGTLVYAGAIDDIPSTDVDDIPSAKNLVLAAYEEAKAGKAVTVSTSQPYGCSIKYAS